MFSRECLTLLPPPPGGSWRATAKHIRVEANATGCLPKAKLETQQTGIVPAFLAPGDGGATQKHTSNRGTRSRTAMAILYGSRKCKLPAKKKPFDGGRNGMCWGLSETLAFAASGRARVSKCWGLWQGARLKTRLLASRKELAETKSELKLARVNLAKAERQLRRQQSATSAVSSVKKTRETAGAVRGKHARMEPEGMPARAFKRLKETLLAALTLLAEFAGSGGFN